MKTHFILYVADQARSTTFYSAVLAAEPTLNVPGMTEFALGQDAVLGLMPEAGIERLLGDNVDKPIPADRSPRAELYLMVDDPNKYHKRALASGGLELSKLQPRDWGHSVAYSLDPDGYVIAFAESTKPAL